MLKIPDFKAFFNSTGFSDEYATLLLFFDEIVVPVVCPVVTDEDAVNMLGWTPPVVLPVRVWATTLVEEGRGKWLGENLVTTFANEPGKATAEANSVVLETRAELTRLNDSLRQALDMGWIQLSQLPIRITPVSGWFQVNGWTKAATPGLIRAAQALDISLLNSWALKIPNLMGPGNIWTNRTWIGSQELSSNLGSAVVSTTVPHISQISIADTLRIRHELAGELLAFRSKISSLAESIRSTASRMGDAGLKGADRAAIQEVFDTEIAPSLREINHFMKTDNVAKKATRKGVMAIKGILKPLGYFFGPATLAGDTIAATEALASAKGGKARVAPDNYGDFGFLVSFGKEVDKTMKRKTKKRK